MNKVRAEGVQVDGKLVLVGRKHAVDAFVALTANSDARDLNSNADLSVTISNIHTNNIDDILKLILDLSVSFIFVDFLLKMA